MWSEMIDVTVKHKALCLLGNTDLNDHGNVKLDIVIAMENSRWWR